MLRVRTGDAAPRQAFGAYLRHAMDQAGIETAADLGTLSGLNRSVIGRWLDNTMRPDIVSLRKVARALHVPPIRLYIAAGHVLADEIELPPEGHQVPPPSAEERIRARFHRRPDLAEVVIAALRAAQEADHEAQPPRRRAAG